MSRNLIITAEELIKLSSSDLDKDSAEIFAEMATDYIHNLVGCSLKYGRMTERLKGNNQNRLYLKKRPVEQLISIVTNGNSGNINDYIVGREYIETKRGVFPQGFGLHFPYLAMRSLEDVIIEVTYLGGYKYPSDEDSGNVPMDLKMGIAMLVNQLIFDNSQNSNLTSYRISDIAYTFAEKTDRDEKFLSILRRHFSW